MAAENHDNESRVGIFWWFNGKLITDFTPLSKAEPYGDALTHATGHIDYWTAQQERGVLPRDVEYEEPPRGRIGYDRKHEEFFLLADKCIIENPVAVKAIIAAFNLPKNTNPQPDIHYRCTKCLSRLHRGQG